MRKRSLLVAVSLLASSLAGAVGVRPAEAAYPGGNGRVAFSGDGGFGTWDLFTMNADGTDLVNLTKGAFDTEGPVWSPDGTKIAFARVVGSPSGCRHGDLLVINADGSGMTELTHNPFGVVSYEPTWSPDGTEIAFTREHWDETCNSGDVDVWKMDADGSDQVLLAAGGHQDGPSFDGEPAWSPDGDRIAFRSDRENVDWARNDQIYTMDTDGSNVVQVTHEEFHTHQANQSPAWSPDGEQLVYQHWPFRPPPGLGLAQIWRINEDGTGAAPVTSSSMYHMNPAWSPDGERVIFNTNFEEADMSVNEFWTSAVDGSDQTRVTFTRVAKDQPDWQPIVDPPPPPPEQTGTIAWVSAGPTGSFTDDIWTMDPDGSDKTNLLPGDASEQSPEWSRDGRKIAFSRSGTFPNGCAFGDLFVMDADGTNVTQVTSSPPGTAAFDPTWSPDGQQLAFSRLQQDPSTCNSAVINIWVTDIDGTNQAAVTSGSEDDQPAWSPDGSRIAFRGFRQNAEGNTYAEIYTVDPGGSNVTKLTDTEFLDPEFNENPVWSPDGTQIAFQHIFLISSNNEVWTMDADGSDEVSVTGSQFTNAIEPTWSPDGTRLAFSGHLPGGDSDEVFTIDVDGSDREQLTDNAIIDRAPTWQELGDPPVSDDVVVTDCDDPALATLTSIVGDLIISDLTDCDVVSLPALVEIGGDLVITDNDGVEHINLTSLTTVNGDLTIVNDFEKVDAPSLVQVGGDVSVENAGSGVLALGGAEPAGELELDLSGYDTVNGATGSGEVSIQFLHPEATMRAELPEGALGSGVAFTVHRLPPSSQVSVEGFGADGTAAEIDPFEVYQFIFDVPTLDADATLTFDVLLDRLDPAVRDDVLAAIDADEATLVTKGDAPGSVYQAFPICVGNAQPSANGCVLVERLDGDGFPTMGTPSIVRFTGITGHFSTWGVATVEPIPEPDEDGDGVPDATDNCDSVDNPNQTDTDQDGTGDACDATPNGDTDNDGIDQLADNCPTVANPGQADTDHDGLGDACDPPTPPPTYPFSGFFAPVDNEPTINKANSGQAIPVKFSLGGDRGLDVLAEGYPRSVRVSCDGSGPVDAIETTAVGKSGLSYDASSGRYTYVWKTERHWSGTCRQLVVGLDDGTFHTALFRFK